MICNVESCHQRVFHVAMWNWSSLQIQQTLLHLTVPVSVWSEGSKAASSIGFSLTFILSLSLVIVLQTNKANRAQWEMKERFFSLRAVIFFGCAPVWLQTQCVIEEEAWLNRTQVFFVFRKIWSKGPSVHVGHQYAWHINCKLNVQRIIPDKHSTYRHCVSFTQCWHRKSLKKMESKVWEGHLSLQTRCLEDSSASG